MKKNNDEIIENQVLHVEYGSKLILPVFGEEYGQDSKQTKLKQLYKETEGKVTEFSLTPQDEYQARKKWPEEPFLNVMPKGEYTVRKDNWLGYIQPPDYYNPETEKTSKDSELDDSKKDRRKYALKLIELGKKAPLMVKGKVIKEKNQENGTEYSLLLFASREDIDKKSSKVKSLQPEWEKARKKKAKNKMALLITGIILLVILGIVFWQFAVGILIIGALLVCIGAHK